MYKRNVYKKVAILMLLIMVLEMVAPTVAYALTDGPTQPETHAFEPVGTTEMVDLFSGDFNYNIPLFDLPGPNGSYPFNLSYHSGISMDEEASWVGLGFSLNPGAIDRSMRGVPDDFDGDKIQTTMDMKDNISFGVGTFGSVAPEIWTTDLSRGTINIGTSLSVYYNTYKGVGYSTGLGVSLAISNGSATSSGSFGLNLNLNSEEGPGLTPNISFSHKFKDASLRGTGVAGGSFEVTFSTRRGLTDISMSTEVPLGFKKKYYMNREGVTKSKVVGRNAKTHSSSFSFAGSAYSPKVDMPMLGKNVNFSLGFGLDPTDVMIKFGITGFYSEDKLKYKNENILNSAYGYLNLQNASATAEDAEERPLIDFNRDRDGLVYENSPNMAMPIMTQDAFIVQGQGVSGMFRAYRNDIGVLYDQSTESKTNGGGFGAEGGISLPPPPTIPSAAHVSVEGTYTHSENLSKRWGDKEGNQFLDGNDFTSWDAAKPLYEPVFFKRPGEMVSQPVGELDAMVGGDKAVKLKLDKFEISADFANSALEDKSDIKKGEERKTYLAEKRRPRNMGIIPVKNTDISNNPLGEYMVQYKNSSNILVNVERAHKSSGLIYSTGKRYIDNSPIDKHIGAITTTNTNGMRYVYALPVYNNVQVEQQFSVNTPADACSPYVDFPTDVASSGSDNLIHKKADAYTSDQFRKKTITPPYAHTYLLTSVLGNDYIDVTGDGPSDDDLGYWVKFNYKLVNDNYKWKAPYHQANYFKGFLSSSGDDKGSYMYGEKEVYYLESAETKTHKAIFETCSRMDAKEAAGEFANTGVGANSYHQLQRITLVSKLDELLPIKVVNFKYEYSLCKNVLNNHGTVCDATNTTTGTGKLTLKSLWFTYQNSQRGRLNAYNFEYGFNPDYNNYSVDRWGSFKPLYDESGQLLSYNDAGQLTAGSANHCISGNMPYTDQKAAKAERDKWASAWQLNRILLPSGGAIEINYESDDYGYVQNKQAMNMFKMSRIGVNTPGTDGYCRIYASGEGHEFSDEDINQKVYFDLVYPIASGTGATSQLAPYFEGIDQLYYRLLIRLRDPDCEKFEEYVSGYATIDSYGFDDNCDPDATGSFTRAYIKLKPEVRNGNPLSDYHPFTFNALQFLRSNLPQYTGTIPCELDASSLPGFGGPTNSNDEAANRAQVLFGMMDNITELFSNFYRYHTGCNSSDPACDENAGKRNWCSIIDTRRSVIRLNTPNKIKYGGGSRVKKLMVKDNWNTVSGEPDSEYGQIFTYTEIENNQTISSGVATYEPLIGGEECALRTVKKFPGRVPCKLDNNLMFEYPINESYYPAPSVGYGKVTVKSINTGKILNSEDGHGASCSGVTVHEFYTAKEFPVITDETKILKTHPIAQLQGELDAFYKLYLPIPIPAIGQILIDHLAFSQGYSIELNDMHGKQKMVSSYELDANGHIVTTPISWVKYNYKCTDETKNGETYKHLNNTVDVLLSDMDPSDHLKAQIESRDMGVDYEIFTDMRYSKSYVGQGGVNVNVELPFIIPPPTGPAPVPVVIPWPNIGYSDRIIKISVVNKVIHRTGILESVQAYDAGSVVTTNNINWDGVTGDVLLSSVNNDFDEPVYTYHYPAHWKYDKAGPAYKNIGLRVVGTLTNISPICGNNPLLYTLPLTVQGAQFLVVGDELVGTQSGSTTGVKLFVTKIDDTNVTLETIDKNHGFGTTPTSVSLYLTRSGRRNLLESKVCEIVALKNPTKGRTEQSCVRTIVPDINAISCSYFIANTVVGTYNTSLYVYNQPVIAGNPFDALSISYESPTRFRLNKDEEKKCRFSFYDSEGQLVLLEKMKGKIVASSSCTTAPTVGSHTYTGISYVYNSPDGDVCVYLFLLAGSSSGCNCTEPETPIDPITIEAKTYTIDSVIRASALKLKDEWTLDEKELRFTPPSVAEQINTFTHQSRYAKGTKGIWRPYESYVYYTDRSPGSSNFNAHPVNTAKHGTYKLTLFDWDNPFYSDCDANWVKVNEVTKYNPYGFETENKDVLNISSSALYSYKSSVPIAVAQNAKQTEIGFEGFEEYAANGAVDQYTCGTGNLDFLTQKNNDGISGTPCTIVTETYFAWGYNNFPFVFISAQVPTDNITGSVILNVQTVFPGGHQQPYPASGSYAVTSVIPDNNHGGQTLALGGTIGLGADGGGSYMWRGEITITRTIPSITPPISGPPDVFDEVAVSAEKAHTGNKSFKVENNISYTQTRLIPKANSKYTISAWVSRQNEKSYATYKQANTSADDNIGIKVTCYTAGGTVAYSVVMQPAGEIINGWQRIESEIDYSFPNDGYFKLTLQPGKIDGVSELAYFDDIRFFPSEGEMKTFVYNPLNYKVSAELDNNNYATFYYYDEQGNLFLVKKETERGIFTISESRQNLKNNP